MKFNKIKWKWIYYFFKNFFKKKIKEYKILKEWTTKSGHKAVVVETSMGHNCGYVGIDDNHPLFGKEYYEHSKELEKLFKQNKENNKLIGKRGVIPLLLRKEDIISMDIYFDVHGSITYSSKNKKYPIKSDLYWIGFDCMHLNDTLEICDLNYCIKECESLSRQLKEVKN
jgi:hypothetical protein